MPSNNNISDKNQNKDIKSRVDNPAVKPTDKSLDRGTANKDQGAMNPAQRSAR
jgi:hypothetical protein